MKQQLVVATPPLHIVSPINLSKQDQQFQYQVHGQWAKGDRIPITTPMSPCQRPVYENDIKKYIRRHKGLNRDLFRVVTAVRLPDGSLEVIDGEQRMTLAITVDPSIKEVPAHIVDFSDLDENLAKKRSYKYFHELNATRKVNNEELFYALVMQEDEEALKIKDLLEKCELSCGKVNKEDGFASVKYASFKKCFDRGEEATVRAAYLFKKYVPFFNDNCFVGTQRWLSLNIPSGKKGNKKWEAVNHQDLLDPNSKAWESCEEFFEDKVSDWQLDDFIFSMYRAHSDWSYGISLGLTKKYCHWTRRHNKSSGLVRVTPIEDFYTATVGEDFDE